MVMCDMLLGGSVGCNSIVKFGAMRDYALDRLQADWIATGHYARLWHRGTESMSNEKSSVQMEMPDYLEEATADAPERDWIATWGMKDGEDSSAAAPSLLLAGADSSKDQSYFLCGVNGHAFRNVLFPLGDLLKKTDGDDISDDNDVTKSHNKSVRDIANEAGLPTATKRESMGICFIGKRNFQSFISQYLPSMPQPGNFVDVDTGEVSFLHLHVMIMMQVVNRSSCLFQNSSIWPLTPPCVYCGHNADRWET